MNVLIFFGFGWRRGIRRWGWALILLTGLSARAAIDTSTNWVPLTELVKKWEPIPLPEIQKAAEDGDVHAAHYLGYCYSEGLRVTRDAHQSLAWYQRALQGGYLSAANNIGMLFHHGRFGSNSMAQAVYHYRYAAERGLDQAQANLGFMYRDGEGVPQDFTNALHWFRLAAAQGHSTAMVEIGRRYRFGEGVESNIDEALRWFEMASKTKDPALAKLNIGLVYQETRGRPEKAVPFFQQAADEGSTEAMVQLYVCYWRGKGVAADHDKAIEWLTKAGNAGDPYAQCLLGDYFEQREWKGEGKDRRLTAPNWAQAFHWSRLSAEQNWPGGQYHLGMLYVRGQGVERDEARGLALVRAAADEGVEAALHDLASLYAQGIGAPRSEADRPINLLWRSKSWEELIRRFERGLGTERDIVSAAECYCETALLNAPYYWRYTLEDKIEYHPGKSQNAWTSFRADDDHVSIGITIPYEDGSDDLRRALSLYLKSAKGDGRAAFQIGTRYLKGQDAPQSNTRAWAWFAIAAREGSSEAREKMKELESQMTPDELKAAERERARQMEKFPRFTAMISN
jgi:TPR repeat protein